MKIIFYVLTILSFFLIYKISHNRFRHKIDTEKILIGFIGESMVLESLLSNFYDSNFFCNIYLRCYNDVFTEIDLIMLNNTGIYVIESKNYSGNVIGNTKKQYWEKKSSTNSFKFYNPILQNKIHIRALRKYLKTPFLKYNSVIVFSDKSNLQIKHLNKSKILICNISELSNSINTFFKQKKNRLSNRRVEKFTKKLYKLQELSEKEKTQHIKRIKKKYN